MTGNPPTQQREAGVVPVGELRGAWLALSTGMFEGPSLRWRDLAPPVVVVGAHGGSGASTTALAIAEATGAAHVLELAGPGQSGLVAAATAEFGEVGPGWVRGRRGVVVIDHLARWPDGSLIPAPARAGPILLVVDLAMVGAGERGLRAARELFERALLVVVTAAATVPGMRRLDAVLPLLPSPALAVAVTRTPRRGLPRPVTAALPPVLRGLAGADRLVLVPDVPSLAVTGVTPDPLPDPVLAAARQLCALIPGAALIPGTRPGAGGLPLDEIRKEIR